MKNPKFAASAPPEVVEETQTNLLAREEEESKLKEALAGCPNSAEAVLLAG